MDQDTKDWLNKIEGKLDTALVAITKHETDISWIKGGASILLIALIGIVGWVLNAYFSGLGK